MAANTAAAETCGSCCDKLKELIKSYEVELGLDEDNDGTKVHAFGSLNFCLEQNKFNDLLNSIRTKCTQCRSWPDVTRAARASMESLQQVENLAPVKNVLSECLEKLQNAMRDTSPKDVVQRLEAITKQIGLKFYDNGTGTDCFISSDMFYVEVQMEHSGKVTEVKVAQAGDPESCPELTRILRERKYDEFINHLKGLSDLYRLSGDTFQKSKIMMSLKAVEIDINMMDALHGPVENSVDTILHSPVGFVTPRQGGRLMRLTYFASPYELLDVDNPGQMLQFTRDSPPPADFGHWVSVSVEQSHKSLLPTMPLIEDPTVTETLEIKYQALNDNNSDELPASFVLKLNKPMVLSAEILGKIYQTVNRAGNFTHCSKVPVDKLLLREWLKENKISKKEQSLTCFVALPEQYHVYHINGTERDADRFVSNAELGLLVYRIPFTHPSHIPDIIQLLRRQATFNTLLTSILRSTEPLKIDGNSEKYVFEVSTSGPFTVTVTFENPCIPGMASVDFTVQEDHHVTATLHTAPKNSAFCRDEYIARVIQKCISIPVAMRSVIKKAASFKPGEHPVIAVRQEMSTPFGNQVPDASSKWMTLNIPPEGFFSTVMKTPTDPSTPSLFSTSPTFATFNLETPSPTITVFPFTSISPSGTSFPFTSTEGEFAGVEATSTGASSKQGENKPLDTPRLKITLKRKRDNEYVIENRELPKSEGSQSEQAKMGSAQKAFAEAMEDETVVEAATQPFGFMEAAAATNVDGTFSFHDTPVASGVTGQLMAPIVQSTPGSVLSPDSAIAAAPTPVVSGTDLVGMVPTTLFDLPGSSGSGVEGILQNLPGGVSHLPPGIVPGSGSMEFDVELEPGVSGMDVPVEANFDFDAAIEASAAADSGIGGAAGVVPPTAGSFDVDAMLSLDLDQIASSGTLPGGAITTDVTDPGDQGAGLMPWGQDISDSMLGLDTGGQGLGESIDSSSKS